MPAAHPPEFRRRAVELARLREKPIATIATDLGISESCLTYSLARAHPRLDGSPETVPSRANLTYLCSASRTPDMVSRW